MRALEVRLLVLLLLAAPAASTLALAASGEPVDFDAVLMQRVGPGAGVTAVDLETLTRLQFLLPTTSVVIARAFVHDPEGHGVTDAAVGGSLAFSNGAVANLTFSPAYADGVYDSQPVAYPGGNVVLRAWVDLLPGRPVEKTYVPIVPHL